MGFIPAFHVVKKTINKKTHSLIWISKSREPHHPIRLDINCEEEFEFGWGEVCVHLAGL